MNPLTDADPLLPFDRATTCPILIVVGSHLRAEQADRKLAYRLQRRIQLWQEQHKAVMNLAIEPLVCSDLWYLNHEPLQRLPTISIGGPGVNALSAFYARQLPESATPGPDPQVLIQIDPDFTDLRVCLWGSNHALTIKGLEIFIRRYLDEFLRAVVTQVEPSEE